MIKKYIEEICKNLEITVPKISYDSSKFLTPTMMASCDGETIYIKPDKPNPDLMFSIAHELRHLWQIKTDKNYYMKDYKMVTEVDIETYNMQIAEIDANAYATIVMADFFHLKPLYQGMSKIVVAAIQNRIKEIINERG